MILLYWGLKRPFLILNFVRVAGAIFLGTSVVVSGKISVGIV